jgi:hypothetical protein
MEFENESEFGSPLALELISIKRTLLYAGYAAPDAHVSMPHNAQMLEVP